MGRTRSTVQARARKIPDYHINNGAAPVQTYWIAILAGQTNTAFGKHVCNINALEFVILCYSQYLHMIIISQGVGQSKNLHLLQRECLFFVDKMLLLYICGLPLDPGLVPDW